MAGNDIYITEDSLFTYEGAKLLAKHHVCNNFRNVRTGTTVWISSAPVTFKVHKKRTKQPIR